MVMFVENKIKADVGCGKEYRLGVCNSGGHQNLMPEWRHKTFKKRLSEKKIS